MHSDIEELDEIPCVYRNHRKVVIERIPGKHSAILFSNAPKRNLLTYAVRERQHEARCRKPAMCRAQLTLVRRPLLVYLYDLG